MSTVIRLARNESNQRDIAAHLRACDDAFVPPLSERVDLDAYAKKLATHAIRFEAWRDHRLVGLVAAYIKADAADPSAFVTDVSVVPEVRRAGIAGRLLASAIAEAESRGLARIALEVDAANVAAVEFYRAANFTIDESQGSTLRLGLQLQPATAEDVRR